MKPYEVGPSGDAEATIYVFAVQDRDEIGEPGRRRVRRRGWPRRCSPPVPETSSATRLNALVVTAGLHWREVDVLRGYAGYAFQVGAVPSRLALPGALVRYPGIARELFELFQTRFEPSRDRRPTLDVREQRAATVEDIRSAFHASLSRRVAPVGGPCAPHDSRS